MKIFFLFEKLKDKFFNFSSDSNFYSLDILRGLSALWVVIFHSLKDHFLPGDTFLSKAIYSFIQNGYLGVPIFFVLSGYCVSVSANKNIKTPLTFMKQRLKRIYPPYLFSILFGYILIFLFKKTGLTQSAAFPTLKNLITSIPLIKTAAISFNGAYWSLTPEVHFYILMFLCLIIFRKYFIYIFDVIALLIFLKLFNNLNSNVFLIAGYFYKFYAGILVYRIFRNLKSYAIIYDLICFYLVFKFNFIDSFVLKIMILFLVLKPFDKLITKINFMKYFFKLGAISYSLYLIHILITPRIIGLTSRILPMNNFFFILVFSLFALPVTLFITYYFYKFFEKPFTHRKIKNLDI